MVSDIFLAWGNICVLQNERGKGQMEKEIDFLDKVVFYSSSLHSFFFKDLTRTKYTNHSFHSKNVKFEVLCEFHTKYNRCVQSDISYKISISSNLFFADFNGLLTGYSISATIYIYNFSQIKVGTSKTTKWTMFCFLLFTEMNSQC